MSANGVYIDPSAIVDEGAEIGSGSKIWHFSHLMPACKLGRNCIIGQNCFVARGVILGDGVKVQNNVSLYEGVIAEDFVFIGPSVVFTNVLNPRAAIERKTEFKPTLLRTGCSIGANATLVCGITIGSFALIGAGSVVTKDVPDFALVVGNPAQLLGWVSKAGHRLHFENGSANCPEGNEEYHIIEGKVSCVNGK